MTRHGTRSAARCSIVLVVPLAGRTSTAELKPATIAAFERYVRATEARIAGEVQSDQRFLYVEGLPDAIRRARLGELASGRLVIERLRTEDNGKPLDPPAGIIQHWLGVAFVPGGTAAAAAALLRTTIGTPRSTNPRFRSHASSSRAATPSASSCASS